MQEALTLAQARAQGQVIDLIPVDRIDGDYLVRDRLVQEEDELQALMTSIQARGQQMPIEIVRLDRDDGEPRYGLISGWRRLTALRRLHRDTDDPRFAVVRALVVRPETAQDAYLSMVEENEIRVDVSHYERARIALKSVEQGVFPDQRAALRGLYASTTRSKRSKIGWVGRNICQNSSPKLVRQNKGTPAAASRSTMSCDPSTGPGTVSLKRVA